MIEVPQFFVPNAVPEKQEELYAELARWARCAAPKRGSRVYSINYVHDGEEWTATVGQTLRGIRHRRTRSKGRTIERTEHRSDAATVIAIFPGIPFMVVTNTRIDANVRSAWENPFMAGEPSSVTLFSAG
jgi:hypothetical protein